MLIKVKTEEKKINKNDDNLQQEIEKYLSEGVVKIKDEPNSESNVLNWWKHNTYRFPYLSKTVTARLAINTDNSVLFTCDKKNSNNRK